VAVSAFPDEIYTAPRSWAERAYPKLIHYNKLDKGGHFAAWEQPYFISHVDVTRIAGVWRVGKAKLTGEPSLAMVFRYLSASRLVTIAQIEGRVRGVGSEFVLGV
jgi:hypothetical protein